MKMSTVLTRATVAALAIFMLHSCNKEEEQLNNLMPYRKDTGSAQVIDITALNTSMTLEDRVNGVDYIIKNNIEVNAALIIKPGVTVMFEDKAGLIINEEGTINAVGNANNVIFFTSQSGKRGAWNGITILSNKSQNILSYCKIEHGGGNNVSGAANVHVGSGNNTARAEISNCEITASKGDGVHISEGSIVMNFASNRIHTNSECPINLHIADAVMLENTNQFANNGKEYVRLTANSNNVVGRTINLKNISESYLISGQITSTAGFTINPGVRIAMDSRAEIIIDGTAGNASFTAVGTQAQPILISAMHNSAGVWNSIRFRSSSSDNNRIEHCTISGGGLTASGSMQGMVSVISDMGSSHINIRNSNIMNSAATGIYIQANNSEYNSDILTANVFNNNAKGNVYFE
jgi:hypothetical protein